MYVDDLAAACIDLISIDKAIVNHHTMNVQNLINVGSGEEVSIMELAALISVSLGYKGTLNFDHTMPDGAPRKLLDCSRLHRLIPEWRPTPFDKALSQTIAALRHNNVLAFLA